MEISEKKTVKDAFPKYSVFRNRKGEDIRILIRLWTSDDNIEYIMISGRKKARVSHSKVLEQLSVNNWIRV